MMQGMHLLELLLWKQTSLFVFCWRSAKEIVFLLILKNSSLLFGQISDKRN